MSSRKHRYASIEAAYQAGYNRGVKWDAPWYPGGPFVYRVDHICREDDEWIEYCRISQEQHDEWHRGFKAGLAKQNKEL